MDKIMSENSAARMELSELVDQAAGFDKFAVRERICLLGWYLHAHEAREFFSTSDIKRCFDRLHITQINIALNLTRMTERTPPDLLKNRQGYRLSRNIRAELDRKYGLQISFVQVNKVLHDLVAKVSDPIEKNFLGETIDCYRVGAYRACIVMTWNLAYSHLVRWILNDTTRLSNFNAAIGRRYNKKTSLVISTYDQFSDELKESEVIEICQTASLLSANVIRILREKLGRRNTAAHPTTVTIIQSQADDVVTDLVNNVLLTLNA